MPVVEDNTQISARIAAEIATLAMSACRMRLLTGHKTLMKVVILARKDSTVLVELIQQLRVHLATLVMRKLSDS